MESMTILAVYLDRFRVFGEFPLVPQVESVNPVISRGPCEVQVLNLNEIACDGPHRHPFQERNHFEVDFNGCTKNDTLCRYTHTVIEFFIPCALN
jgi:hypothetical protein